MIRVAFVFVLFATAAAAQPPEPESSGEAVVAIAARAEQTLFDFTMKTIDGEDQPLSAYRGKAVLIVNVASRCGLTPQYEALEQLYREKKDQGLVILAFPANDFAGQEPGTNDEIKAFCKERYDVTFPLFAKISVTGKDQHELYQWLTGHPKPRSGEAPEMNPSADSRAAVGGDIPWNFTKFLIGPDGKPVARFDPRTKPDDPALIGKIDDLLAALPKDEKETPAP